MQNEERVKWYVATAGTSTDPDRHDPPFGYRLPNGKTPKDIVGIGIAQSGVAYCWYKDGYCSAGSRTDLGAERNLEGYTLQVGKTPANIVGMSIYHACYAYYDDLTFSVGSSQNLAEEFREVKYELPEGIDSSSKIIDIACNGFSHPSRHLTSAWFNDNGEGKVSGGVPGNLGSKRQLSQISMPPGLTLDQLVAVAKAPNDGATYYWWDSLLPAEAVESGELWPD